MIDTPIDQKALEAAENAYSKAQIDLPYHDCDVCGGSDNQGGDPCRGCGGMGLVVDFPDDWSPMGSAIRAYLDALSRRVPASGELEPDTVALTVLANDPNAVHANLLRGSLARPSVAQIIHVYGEDALRAALPAPEGKAEPVGLRKAIEALEVATAVRGEGGPDTREACWEEIDRLIPSGAP